MVSAMFQASNLSSKALMATSFEGSSRLNFTPVYPPPDLAYLEFQSDKQLIGKFRVSYLDYHVTAGSYFFNIAKY